MSGAGEGELLPMDLSQLSEEDLLAWDKEELVQRLRKAEGDKIAALVQRGRLIQEVNRQLQGHLREIRELKAVNSQLQEENQELRDLCCFLDEDRLKVKGLAREWQAFGRYAARVMREDVGGYLRKLANLERLQGALARENLELRELCAARYHHQDEEEENCAARYRHRQEEEENCAARYRHRQEEEENCDARYRHRQEEEENCDASPAGSSDLNIPCGPRDLGDGSSSTGSVGSPDQTHLACSPED
ncbi:hypothetical protein scyTo_0022908 [Scyliorhinus torazame]|uniref:Coiled-coil domain-containing protein 85B n=1 Tax=Scyliorhinus torazame TaxID=75743 RepID=A0A401QAR5_SCYTO|nr:hypothetical protein [Scyliorhinus torazame]